MQFALETLLNATIKTTVVPRKQPQQRRSRQMTADILTAAIRVLKREGALGFTTTKVAETAGVSVGSLYQYYPNKQSILLALQCKAARNAWEIISKILADQTTPHRDRIGEIAHFFFAAESEEMRQMGAAMRDSEMVLAKGDELTQLDAEVQNALQKFLDGAPANGLPRQDAFGDVKFLIATIEAIGRNVAAQQMSNEQVANWANRTTQMICDHLGIAAAA